MAKIEKNSLGYLGFDYQVRLVAQILDDRLFGNTIIDIVDPNYFIDPYLRIIVATIKDAKESYDIIPDIGSLEIRLVEDVKEDSQRRFVLAQLQKVKEASLNDTLKIQDIAIRFCKQQELQKSIREIQKIIDKGNLEDYEQCESILRKALEHGNAKDDGIDVFHNIDAVLSDDFRSPIRTGIKGLDEVMNGGLSKGELAVILAPFGVGKTTMMTKIAHTAYMDGKRVVQIFFEDMPKIIQRKHLACWTGHPLNDLGLHKEQINAMVAEMESDAKENGTKGFLKLRKFSSDGTTMPMIKAYLRKLIAQGLRPDIVLLDYIDCVVPSKHYDDVNVGEGAIMRQFEAMLAELDIAGWTAVQGNRSSIKAEIVEADQMSGSIKKGMIGHFIVSIAKTLDQKENGTATMAILKSRFGKDGLTFPDITFDNSRIQIEMGQNKGARTRSEIKQDTQTNQQARLNEVLEAMKSKKALENGPTTTGAEGQ